MHITNDNQMTCNMQVNHSINQHIYITPTQQ